MSRHHFQEKQYRKYKDISLTSYSKDWTASRKTNPEDVISLIKIIFKFLNVYLVTHNNLSNWVGDVSHTSSHIWTMCLFPYPDIDSSWLSLQWTNTDFWRIVIFFWGVIVLLTVLWKVNIRLYVAFSLVFFFFFLEHKKQFTKFTCAFILKFGDEYRIKY